MICRLVPHAPLISVFDFAIPWLHLWLGRFTGQARVQRLPLSRYKLSFHVGSGVIGCSRRSARRRDRVSRLLADAHRQRRGLYRASPLGDGFAWLGTRSALIMLSVAALVEVLAYTIPVIDNLLDVVSAPAAFIAGTILSAAVMTGMPPMVKWTAAVIAGGGVAGLTRGSLGVLRAHSTVLTGGLGNFVISTAELGGAALISFLAFAAPIAAIALVALLLYVAMRLLRRLLRGAKPSNGRT